MTGIDKIISRWVISAELTNRFLNLFFRFVQLAIFCKVFDMNRTGYLLTATASIILFLAVSYILDKSKIREKIESRSAEKSGAWIDLMKRLTRIEGKLDA